MKKNVCPKNKMNQELLTRNNGIGLLLFILLNLCFQNQSYSKAAPQLAITCPSNMTVRPNTASCTIGLGDIFNAGGDDYIVSSSCPITSSYPQFIVNSINFPVGINTVTWVVKKTCGLTSSCSFEVNVVNDPPVITCPPDLTIRPSLDSEDCTVSLSEIFNAGGVATATDDIGLEVSYPQFIVNSLNFGVGVGTVKWVAQDICGLRSYCEQKVTVVNDPPVITCSANVTVNTDPGLCSAFVQLVQPGTIDNCGIQSITNNAPAGNIFSKGTTNVIWTATDSNGNTATCSQTVTVVDDEAPVIGACGKTYIVELKPVTYQKTTVYRGSLPQAKIKGTITDNCDAVGKGLTVVFSQTTFTPADWGTNTETVTVTDSEGNTTSCTITVVVRYPLKSGEIGGDEEIDEPEFTNLRVYVYPNPTKGRVMLELYNYQNPDVFVQVMNITGQKVFEQQCQTQGWIELDLTGNKTGLYLINVMIDNQKFVEKIMLKEN